MPIGTTHKKMREVMSKFRYPTLAFSVLCAMALSTPGSAQQAGTYTGTSSDGQSVSFTVGLDGNSVLAVTGAGISYEAPCKGGSAPCMNGQHNNDSKTRRTRTWPEAIIHYRRVPGESRYISVQRDPPRAPRTNVAASGATIRLCIEPSLRW